MMRFVSSILFIGLIVATTAGAEPKKYVDTTDHFSVEIPDGWEQTPQEFVDASNGMLKQNPQAKDITYVAGFRPKNLKIFDGVYCLVQRNLKPYAPPSSLDKAFKQITGTKVEKALDKAVEKMSLLVSKAKLQKPYLDRERQMIFLPMEMTAVFGGKVKVLAVVCLGKKGIAQLNFCSEESAWEKHYPEFKKMIDSFQFDPGYEYRERGAWLDPKTWPDWVIGGIVGMFIGLVVTGGMLLYRHIWRKWTTESAV